MAFVVKDGGTRLDVDKTEKIFAHPKGGYPITSNGKPAVLGRFRPIGSSIGIFEYQGTFYFDTFFDGWGDFEGKRGTQGKKHASAAIINTLGVFLHKNGRTRQVCEFLMTDDNAPSQ